MANIWFTIYTGSIDQYEDIANYRTLMEILLVPRIQEKINKDKKVKKIMLMFYSKIEEDNVDDFKERFFNAKPYAGIINFSVSTKTVDWNNLTVQERKDFLIDKWQKLFNILSDDYFTVEKSEILEALGNLKNEEWKIEYYPIKKKVKYKKETYKVITILSLSELKLVLERESDKRRFILNNYETWKISTDADFKNFKLEGDTLTFVNGNLFNTMFETPAVFDLKEFIN